MPLRVTLVLCIFVSCVTTHAATTTVKSIAELQSAIERAAAGDVIVVADGSYMTTAALAITRAGTKSAPISIKAATVGGVTLAGSDGFNVKSPAAHIVIEGFVFAHASGKTAIGAGTSHVRFTRNTFQCVGDGPFLNVLGDDAQVDRNEFRDKKTVGNMISVTGVAPQVARRLWIHHNYFHDFAAAGANGAETIRFGLSGLSMSDGHGLVEHNLFVRCVGENELISNKSGANTYRYNTFLESRGAQLTLRHGNECVVYGNYFRGSAGVRIFGDRHWIFSNYFEGNSVGIQLGNGGAEVADGAPLVSHDRPDNCVIAFNTLVNNTRNYIMDARNNGLGAISTAFANNLIQGGGPAAEIKGPNTGATWTGNLIWKTRGAGDLPAGTFTEADPKLVADKDGIFRLQKGSPAIDAATGTLPAAKFDLDGQPRTIAKDIGADEFSDLPATARILGAADVGPRSGL